MSPLLRQLSIFFLALIFSAGVFGQSKKIKDPTGVYSYDGEVVEKDGEMYGYSGTVMVKMLSPGKIMVNLYVNKGAPSYNSGSMIDTLAYRKNTAIWVDSSMAPCKLVFHFYRRKLFVEMFADNPNFACGFGHAVDAHGTYNKIEGKKPTDEDMLSDGAIGRIHAAAELYDLENTNR